MFNEQRFTKTIEDFDSRNAQDPNLIMVDGLAQPKELVYSSRLYGMLLKYAPDASESLKLAARSQHIERWSLPRNTFPMTKPGYMQWRGQLKLHHAHVATNVMENNGYDAESIAHVCSLLKKENLQTNTAMQTLEDVIVLAFLEYDLAEFVTKNASYSEEKFIDIVRKSYLKMSKKGQQAALSLITIPAHLLPVVLKAVN
jgi:hypothetical protein